MVVTAATEPRRPHFAQDGMRLDPRDPAFFRDPWPAYAAMHERGASHIWLDYGFRYFCAHADVHALLRDPRFGRVEPMDPPPSRPGMEAFDAVERYSLLELEPPDHTRLRGRVNRAFVSRAIGRLAPAIDARANELIERFPEEPFDLIAAYAAPLAVETIALHLGVPRTDADRLLTWSHAMVAMYQFGIDDRVRCAANDAAADFSSYVRAAMGAKRSDPSDDLLSTLVRPDAARTLTDDEIVATVILLLNAGHEATVHQIGNAVAAILARPAPGAWCADEGATERMVEEAMRHDPPLHMFTRIARDACDWTDADGRRVPIGRGETVGLLLGAANRDPRRFTEPDAFDPAREPIDHVAFGGGIHFCVGAPLARLEMRIALRTLFARLTDLRLHEVPIVADTYHFHGLERLMVTR